MTAWDFIKDDAGWLISNGEHNFPVDYATDAEFSIALSRHDERVRAEERKRLTEGVYGVFGKHPVNQYGPNIVKGTWADLDAVLDPQRRRSASEFPLPPEFDQWTESKQDAVDRYRRFLAERACGSSSTEEA